MLAGDLKREITRMGVRTILHPPMLVALTNGASFVQDGYSPSVNGTRWRSLLFDRSHDISGTWDESLLDRIVPMASRKSDKYEGVRLAKLMKSKSELEEIALKRTRRWPGCRGASILVLTLDDDGEWSFEVSDAGSADPDTVRRAAISVGHAMHDEFDLTTDI